MGKPERPVYVAIGDTIHVLHPLTSGLLCSPVETANDAKPTNVRFVSCRRCARVLFTLKEACAEPRLATDAMLGRL